MNGDIQRREALLDNSAAIAIGQIRKRNEIPVRERQSVIIVLNIQRLPQTGRLLVYKAKDAIVGAPANTVFPESQSQRHRVVEVEFGLFPGAVSENQPQRISRQLIDAVKVVPDG